MRPNILDTIAAAKKDEIAVAKRKRPLNRLIRQAEKMPPTRPFTDRLNHCGNGRVRIIAEIKRASPSAGIIRENLDAATQAAQYAAGGAAAVSVLTDHRFFRGDPADMAAAKAACPLPILRKDFIISTYQVYESRVDGADAILLIVRMLPERQLTGLLQLAGTIGLDALVEIHTQADLDIARRSGARLIGINNRDLSSFQTDTRRAVDLIHHLVPGQIPVAASGIHGRDDIEAGLKAGIHNFLIGEHLVRSEDPAARLRKLRGDP
jgi:indole-3-glycerol phosphate synthase